MARLGDHRVGAVSAAEEGAVRVRVNVGDDREAGRAAERPQRPERGAVQIYDPRVERVGIEVVVVDEPLDAATGVVTRSEEEGAALAPTGTASSEFGLTSNPEGPVTGETVARGNERPRSPAKPRGHGRIRDSR